MATPFHHWPENSKRGPHPLEIYLRKNMYTRQLGAGLGWVGAASGSVIFPELH
jgi:hypothetical protein